MSGQKRQSLKSGAFLWGRRRVEAGLSIKQLEVATGIFRGFLSRMENGVMFPTAEEYEKVEAAIAAAKTATIEGSVATAERPG